MPQEFINLSEYIGKKFGIGPHCFNDRILSDSSVGIMINNIVNLLSTMTGR